MLQPLSNYIVLKKIEQEATTIGGIVLPDSAKNEVLTAEVVAIGQSRYNAQGQELAHEVSVGDKVIYSSYAMTTYKEEGVEYLIMREDEILAIIK